MRTVIRALAAVLVLAAVVDAQQAGTRSAGMFVVGYFEVAPASRTSVSAGWQQYREASRAETGLVDLELLEQIGRPGHFATIEAWSDQASADRHGEAAGARKWREILKPIALAPYDQRPYKPVSVGGSQAAAGNGIYVITHVDTIPAPQSDAPALLTRLAEASRRDAGNVRFEVLQHTMRANHFTLIEVWRDEKALDGHAAAAHTIEYRSELHPTIGSPLDERIYRRVGP